MHAQLAMEIQLAQESYRSLVPLSTSRQVLQVHVRKSELVLRSAEQAPLLAPEPTAAMAGQLLQTVLLRLATQQLSAVDWSLWSELESANLAKQAFMFLISQTLVLPALLVITVLMVLAKWLE